MKKLINLLTKIDKKWDTWKNNKSHNKEHYIVIYVLDDNRIRFSYKKKQFIKANTVYNKLAEVVKKADFKEIGLACFYEEGQLLKQICVFHNGEQKRVIETFNN